MAYCLGGTPVTPSRVAGQGLTCRSAAVTMAGCGSAWPWNCGRWLPLGYAGTWVVTWIGIVAPADVRSGSLDCQGMGGCYG